MKKNFCYCLFSLFITHNLAAENAIADALYQEAAELCQQKNFAGALNKLHAVLAAEPTHLLANFRLGLVSQATGNCQEAVTYYRQAVASSDKRYNSGILYHNLATCLKALGNLDEALASLEKAAYFAPEDSNIHKNLGELYLLNGNFTDGWATMEKCWGSGWAARKVILQQKDLTGVIVLVHDGDGYGDTFNWLRYLKMLKERHATIYVKARPALIPFFKLCDYIDKIIPQQHPLPSFTVEVGFLQLTPIFCDVITDIPNKIPYITGSPEREEYWQHELAADHKFRIGICWECKTYIDNMTQRALEKVRALPLMQFYPLSKLPGVSLYCLQLVDGIDQLNHIPADFKIHRFGPTFDKSHGRFIDTAAVMKNIDLVITVDTSVAHLAGALGVPVWVLLPAIADWRWFRDRTDSPWYPSMRLFRQKTTGDWGSVMQEVSDTLQQLTAQQQTTQQTIFKQIT